MKKKGSVSITIIGMLLLMLACVLPAWAEGGNHYQPGSEGALAPSVPPPGVHYRQYFLYLDSDTMTNDNGDDLYDDFDLSIMASVQRLIYISNHKFLGADYGFDLIVPFTSTDLKIGDFGVSDSEIGLGDTLIEPVILGWHKDRYDVAFAWGIFLPTGDFDSNQPVNSGFGYFSTMLTLGVTYFLDQAKTWSISALSRTLVYGEQDETDMTPGSEFIVDWAIAKEFPISKGLLIRPGLCGYAYWQIDEDSGPGIHDEKGRKFAIGGEVNLFWLPPHLFQANLRVLRDFDSKDEVEGTKVFLTLTKSF